MDKISNQFRKIISYENMEKALKDSCKNVRWKDSVLKYEANGLIHCARLINQFKNNTYKIQKYRYMIIHEPKERIICCTALVDRHAQHCICDNYLYNTLCKSFIYDNFACQKGKGNHKFIERLTQHLCQFYRENNNLNEGYALTCDIKSFFNSIPHEVAKQAVAKRVDCKEVVDFVNQIIDGFKLKPVKFYDESTGKTVIKTENNEENKGLYAGGQVVQLVALSVLDDLDHFIKEKLHIKHYMRYNDDFILIYHDKNYLKYCKNEIQKELNKIGLELKESKTKITPLNKGFKILHWRFILTRTGKILRYAEKSKEIKCKHKIKKMVEKEKDGLISTDKTNDIVRSYCEYMKQGNTTYKYKCRIKEFLTNQRQEMR